MTPRPATITVLVGPDYVVEIFLLADDDSPDGVRCPATDAASAKGEAAARIHVHRTRRRQGAAAEAGP